MITLLKLLTMKPKQLLGFGVNTCTCSLFNLTRQCRCPIFPLRDKFYLAKALWHFRAANQRMTIVSKISLLQERELLIFVNNCVFLICTFVTCCHLGASAFPRLNSCL